MIMGELVNLRRYKKRGERAQSANEADANRVRFGRSKAERSVDAERTRRADELLDQHRIDEEGAS
jgi:Domain of unknown function (DUF4169)